MCSFILGGQILKKILTYKRKYLFYKKKIKKRILLLEIWE